VPRNVESRLIRVLGVFDRGKVGGLSLNYDKIALFVAGAKLWAPLFDAWVWSCII
jgi:hypothetical protein